VIELDADAVEVARVAPALPIEIFFPPGPVTLSVPLRNRAGLAIAALVACGVTVALTRSGA
jgi:hypothetical protein